MSLKLMYITNNTDIAKIVEKYGVDRVWVDLEKRGKSARQKGLNTVQSTHNIDDIHKIRQVVSKSELLVRSNPMYDDLKSEIDEIVHGGADIIMLPYFTMAEEVKKFADYVNGRVKTILLVETIGAENNIEDILTTAKREGIDEIHIGLNDLHLQYHMNFMFELLANGKVEKIGNKIKEYAIPFGFGGIAKLDEGMLPARHIIAEHYRLGSSMTILSRSFYDSWISNDLEEIERVFKYGIGEIREYEQRLENETAEFFDNNRRLVEEEVKAVVDKLKYKE